MMPDSEIAKQAQKNQARAVWLAAACVVAEFFAAKNGNMELALVLLVLVFFNVYLYFKNRKIEIENTDAR